jgi:hypothetical protein
METNNKNFNKTALFFGWQGSLPRHRAKYQQLWEDLGFNSVSLGFRFDHLVNKFAVKAASRKLCDTLVKEQLDKQPLVIHVCSNGGLHNYFGFLDEVRNNKEYAHIESNIKGYIFDSAPGRHNIPTLAKLTAVNFGKILGLVAFLLGYLYSFLAKVGGFLVRSYWLRDYEGYVDARFRQYVGRKHLVLFLYSKADPLIQHDYVDDLIVRMKSEGCNVSSLRWDDTPHVGHYHKKPEEYRAKIQELLSSIRLD